MELSESPHRRLNPLTGEWVLVSPQRTQRPWLGQIDDRPDDTLPEYDPDCYLCPGNLRAGGERNPVYSGTYVFDNDYPALLLPQGSIGVQPPTDPWSRRQRQGSQVFFTAEPEYGLCRVVCFSPRHDLTIPELSQSHLKTVVGTWIDQTAELSGLDFIQYVQIFENKGAMMGASNPHPHCQVWATSQIPTEPSKELRAQSDYFSHSGTCLLCEYLKLELKTGERVIASNQQFTALVPFWAVWPYEILLLSNRHVPDLLNLDEKEITGLADMLQQVITRYDNLFEISFPYSMGFHQAPFDGSEHSGWHLHAHYYPPLLRSATVRKFMVGFEMLASPQRDLTPEFAAETLRSLNSAHYKIMRKEFNSQPSQNK
jgi:UDPglucose--hexose-1-phosphate uridylyltransferase